MDVNSVLCLLGDWHMYCQEGAAAQEHSHKQKRKRNKQQHGRDGALCPRAATCMLLSAAKDGSRRGAVVWMHPTFGLGCTTAASQDYFKPLKRVKILPPLLFPRPSSAAFAFPDVPSMWDVPDVPELFLSIPARLHESWAQLSRCIPLPVPAPGDRVGRG